jgi:Ni,Fe-hydrogenase I small subunit
MIILANRTTRMVPCYTCLDQSFPDDTASLAQNNTPNRQETAHRVYSIIKHQHTIIRAIIHKANKET